MATEDDEIRLETTSSSNTTPTIESINTECSIVQGQFIYVDFGGKKIGAFCILDPYEEHDLFWCKIAIQTTDEDFSHMNGEELVMPLQRVSIPKELEVDGRECTAILKQYCVVINELTKDKEFDCIEGEIFKMRLGSFLDQYLSLYDLPASEVFGGTPTLIKLVGYLIILEKLEEKIKNDYRFPLVKKNEILSVLECTFEVLKFYICALCENQREMHPEGFGMEEPEKYNYSNNLTSGVERGLMGLEGASNSVVRNTIRLFRGIKVYTLEELTTKLNADSDQFTRDYFLNYPHDVCLVPEDTNKLARVVQNNPRTTFWAEVALVSGAAVASSSVLLPLVGGITLASLASTGIQKYFGIKKYKEQEIKNLVDELKSEQEHIVNVREINLVEEQDAFP